MIIERHKLIGQIPVKRRVPKVTKIEPVKNGVYMSDLDCPDKLEPKTYDTVLAYCQSCGNRMDIPIVHDKATNNQFQLVSVPVEFSNKLDNYKIDCINCGSTNIIEKQDKISSYEVFTIKLDCSNKNEGTDSWYENDSSSSGDGHPRKF
jgi:hypothetical protein